MTSAPVLPPQPRAAQCSEFNELLQMTVSNLGTTAGSSAGPLSIPTGFTELDEVTAGLFTGTLTVIGAHPGVGSSTLALDIARCAAVRHGIATAFLTLDSTPDSVAQRLLSAEAKIILSNMRSSRMTDADWQRLARRTGEIADAPITITRPENPDVTSVLALADELVADKGVRLIVVDSLHLVTARQDMPYENREREVAEVTRRLKRLALDADAAVVVTAQLSTNPGPRMPAPASPTLADIRDSGTIAHVADYVVLIHRPDFQDPYNPRGGEADLILAKNRFGPPTTATIAHQLHYSRFVEMARG